MNMKNQSQSSLLIDVAGKNIFSAFRACIEYTKVDAFANCNTLEKINMPKINFYSSGIKSFNEGGTAPNFCVDMATKINGKILRRCYTMNAENLTLNTTFNTGICYNDAPAGTICDGVTTTVGSIDPCDTLAQQPPESPKTCQTHSDCTTIEIGDICNISDQTGTCDPVNGTCS